jgi:hypothetical protein
MDRFTPGTQHRYLPHRRLVSLEAVAQRKVILPLAVIKLPSLNL